MNPQKARDITTKEDARQFAIDYQNWQSTQSLSYSELCDWNEELHGLALRFDLTEEFKENAII